ncbi:MAG TPA: hypothetical protein V6C86_15825 [Oculatellaceae cyanobacterium]
MKEFFRQNPRIAGLLLLIFSGAFSKFTIFDVIEAANHHATTGVSLSLKGVGVTIIAAIIGLLMLIFGPFSNALLRPPPGTKKLTPLNWAVVLFMITCSFGFYFGFQHYIESFGYSFDQ